MHASRESTQTSPVELGIRPLNSIQEYREVFLMIMTTDLVWTCTENGWQKTSKLGHSINTTKTRKNGWAKTPGIGQLGKQGV